MSESPCRLTVSLKSPSDPAASTPLRVSGNAAALFFPPDYSWSGPQLCEPMQFPTLELGASWRSSWSWMPWRVRPPSRNGVCDYLLVHTNFYFMILLSICTEAPRIRNVPSQKQCL
jgi:hypothetical protein